MIEILNTRFMRIIMMIRCVIMVAMTNGGLEFKFHIVSIAKEVVWMEKIALIHGME